MKNIAFLFFLMATIVVAFSSSTCRKVEDPEPIDLDTTSGTGDPDPAEKVTGNLKLLVHRYTSAGFPAPFAEVKLAYNFDSLTQGKFFVTKFADSLGFVLFEDLYVGSKVKSKAYFARAEEDFAGEHISSMNTPEATKEFLVPKNGTLNEGIYMKAQ